MDSLMCMVSERGYREKPQGRREVGRLRNSFVPYRGTISTLARRISQGKPFMCAVTEGGFRADCWRSQELLALDFDNKERFIGSGDAIERLKEHGIPTAICYRSYSSTPEHERYRLVIALDERIDDAKLALSLQRRLLALFPEADQSCKDLSRMFYGTNRKVDVVEEHRAAIESILGLPDPEDIKENEAPRRKPRAFDPASAPEGWVDLEALKRDGDLLGIAERLTDAPTFKIGGVVYFPGECPVCGHRDCFRYFEDGNAWHCFGGSNHTGFSGGSIIDFIMAVNGLPDDAEGFKCALSLLEENR